MIPNSFSASALKVFKACPARYKAEMIDKAAQFAGSAADLGTALHAALELYVGGVKIQRNLIWSLENLLACWDKAFSEVFGTDKGMPEYKEGKAILVKWYTRPYSFTDIGGCTVLSMEEKDSFPIPVIVNGQKAQKPFNFIIDRLDKLGPGEYRVVDYKSQRLPVSAEDLWYNIQARAYAVAVAIKYKDAEKIWVEFDLLRHEKVGIVFTREDNIDTWAMLCEIAQTVINTPDDDLPEHLNAECMYCVRKATCETLASNVDAGGIFALDIDTLAIKFADVEAQLKALGYLKNDLEKQLILAASERGELNFDTKFAIVKVTAGSRREIQNDKIADIIGPLLMARYGNITLGIVDELLKGDELTEGQKAAIRAAITKKTGDPKVRVTKR